VIAGGCNPSQYTSVEALQLAVELGELAVKLVEHGVQCVHLLAGERDPPPKDPEAAMEMRPWCEPDIK
jgi:hypothetical protein